MHFLNKKQVFCGENLLFCWKNLKFASFLEFFKVLVRDFDFKIVLLCAFVVIVLCYMSVMHQKQSKGQQSLIKYSKLNFAYYKTSAENGLAVPMTAQNKLPKYRINTSINNANNTISHSSANLGNLHTTSSAKILSYGGNGNGSYATTQNGQKTKQTTDNASLSYGFLSIATPVKQFNAKFADDNIIANDITKRATPEGGGAQEDDDDQSTVKLPLTTDNFVIIFMSILGVMYSLIKYKIVK